MIKISVIIPIYNMEKYLERCLDSIFYQTLSDIEVICIDDGSSDRTIDILNDYDERNHNMRVLHQFRRGAGVARNRGIEIATGEFIAFMDSDDYYPSNDVLYTLYEGARKNHVSMAGGNMVRVQGTMIKKETFIDTLYFEECRIISYRDLQLPYGFYRYIFDAKLLKDNNIFFPDLVRFQDPPFMFSALLAAKKIWVTPKEVYAYREFDKKIDYSSKRVVCDIMKGFLNLMTQSRLNNLLIAQDDFLKKIYKQSDLFISHICNGNEELFQLIRLVGKQIALEDKRVEYMQFWTMNNIQSVYDERRRILLKLEKKISQHKYVIIYGAGHYGKTLYDYVSTLKNSKFLGFAVTSRNSNEIARGFKVKGIDEYIDYVDEALVLVAVRNDKDSFMQKYAKKIGFRNVLWINEHLSYIGIDNITDGQFAFDN